jgi:peptidoglycan/xylan/chitin deacetylase (PgdA/CDA1 family)
MATNSVRLALATTVAACTALLASTATGSAQRAASAHGVPVLMFHVIGAESGARMPELYVSPATFRAQVDWLAAHGYHAVTLDAVYRHWLSRAPLPRKPVVLSFDDGYPGDVDVAMPTLRAHGWSGVLNLQVDNIVPARVRLLIAAGWEIDSHTFTHPDLTHVSAAQLVREIVTSRTWIRNVFKVPANFFCYPSGRYDAAVVAAVRRAGYLGATTTNEGFASPDDGLFTLRRVRVNGSDGVAGLARKLGAG